MKLATHDLAALYFPKTEWQCLRGLVRLEAAEAAPDQFLWAAEVSGKLWAWHPRGGEVDVENSPTKQVRVLELETDGDELEAHALYLKTIFTAEPAHDAEWVVALQTLETRLNYDAASRGLPKYWAYALQACGLEPHLGVLAGRARYLFLKEAEVRLLFEKRWDLAVFELLEPATEPLREALVQAIRKWNLTSSNAKEAINFALILARKMGERSAISLLTNPAFTSAEAFRMGLFRTAQPELASLAQQRIEALRNLKVPPRSSVYGDPTFENDVIKITHNPRRTTDFETFRDWVADPATLEKIRALLEIYNQ